MTKLEARSWNSSNFFIVDSEWENVEDALDDAGFSKDNAYNEWVDMSPRECSMEVWLKDNDFIVSVPGGSYWDLIYCNGVKQLVECVKEILVLLKNAKVIGINNISYGDDNE